jgi:hypothetical protein
VLRLTPLLLLLLLNGANAHSLTTRIFDEISCDYQNYYRIAQLGQFMSGIALSGVMANTDFDVIFRDEWQHRIRGHLTNKLSNNIDGYSAVMHFPTVIPIYAASMLLSYYAENHSFFCAAGHWGNHALRTLILGAPQQAILTSILGSGRPESNQPHWHFFKYHRAVSGHAFYGAIPLLNFAKLSSHPFLKSTGYLLSLLPGLARINLDKHYASQAFLGWWLAFCATNVVWNTDKVSEKPQNWSWQITPTYHAIFLGFSLKI